MRPYLTAPLPKRRSFLKVLHWSMVPLLVWFILVTPSDVLPIAPPLGLKRANEVIGTIHIFEYYLLAVLAIAHAGFHIWRHIRLRDNALRIMVPRIFHRYF
tara:strand:- start:1131 stop:1433 length:303 start_codon:yes stop_codon:yes gene_type:complete